MIDDPDGFYDEDLLTRCERCAVGIHGECAERHANASHEEIIYSKYDRDNELYLCQACYDEHLPYADEGDPDEIEEGYLPRRTHVPWWITALGCDAATHSAPTIPPSPTDHTPSAAPITRAPRSPMRESDHPPAKAARPSSYTPPNPPSPPPPHEDDEDSESEWTPYDVLPNTSTQPTLLRPTQHGPIPRDYPAPLPPPEPPPPRAPPDARPPPPATGMQPNTITATTLHRPPRHLGTRRTPVEHLRRDQEPPTQPQPCARSAPKRKRITLDDWIIRTKGRRDPEHDG